MGFFKQYDKANRYYSKLLNQDGTKQEYEDVLWEYFQIAWHLKDHIKNDPVINIDFDIEGYGKGT